MSTTLTTPQAPGRRPVTALLTGGGPVRRALWLALAADGESPLARRSKPNRVRLSSTAMKTPITAAMIRKP